MRNIAALWQAKRPPTTENRVVIAFLADAPTLEANWRAGVLFGRNVASYKFALAKSLLSQAGRPNDRIRLEELEPSHRDWNRGGIRRGLLVWFIGRRSA